MQKVTFIFSVPSVVLKTPPILITAFFNGGNQFLGIRKNRTY
eukprot:UN24515